MDTDKAAVIGYYVDKEIRESREKIRAYMSNKANIYSRMLFTIADYLTIYSKTFVRVRLRLTDQEKDVFPNGTLTGVLGMVNRSEVDFGVLPVTMNEVSKERVDFVYPYKLYSATFVTRKAEYKPHIFGILQTFSLPLWISIISVLIAMSLVYHITLKRRYSFDKNFLHAFAVLLRQSSILKPSSIIENVLVFSWVVGAMFLCLAYESVFLSFLAFPPITPIKDIPQLANAVKEGHYHCIATPESAIFKLLSKSKHDYLSVIGRDLQMNNLSKGNTFQDFFYDKSKQDLALLVDTDIVDIMTVGKKFVSEDRFFESMAAMPGRKVFCCKKMMDKFVHRFMASGLYFKYQNDKSILVRLPRLLEYEETDTSKRKLTLTDVAPAFMFLIFGHIISFIVFVVEILSNPMKKVNRWKKNKKNKNENYIQRRF